MFSQKSTLIFASEITNRKKKEYETNKNLMSAFAIVLASTACAGKQGENKKKSNEPTKEENKMEVVSLNKSRFLEESI